jgi:hypothetical protein
MPSRILIRGRNVAVSSTFKGRRKIIPIERVNPNLQEDWGDGRQVFSPTQPTPEFPPEWPGVQVIGRPFWDDADKLNYKMVYKLNLEDGWCTADQLLKFYSISYKELLYWARSGIVDPAMQYGSPTKRYRVLSPARANARLKELNQRRYAEDRAKGGRAKADKMLELKKHR